MAEGTGRAQRTDEERRRQEALAAAIATGILVVVVLFGVLLLWHPWTGGGAGTVGPTGGGGLAIVSVQGRKARTDVVAVVGEQGSSITAIISRNGLSTDGAVDLGEGSYMIPTGGRDAATVIALLKRDPGVLDAGYIYEDTSGGSAVTTVPVPAGSLAPTPASSSSLPPTGALPLP